MKIIEINKLENGAHRNQNFEIIDSEWELPEGWAVIPENMEMSNFPFGEVSVEEINGIKTIKSWKPLELPEIPSMPKSINERLSKIENVINSIANHLKLNI